MTIYAVEFRGDWPKYRAHVVERPDDTYSVADTEIYATREQAQSRVRDYNQRA